MWAVRNDKSPRMKYLELSPANNNRISPNQEKINAKNNRILPLNDLVSRTNIINGRRSRGFI